MNLELNSIIKIKDLPPKLLDQFPYSIRFQQPQYILSDLPTEIQYLIKKYYEQQVVEVEYDTVYDSKFEISNYSDFGIYNSKKELVLDYFCNYLKMHLGSYPYDVNFGCALKKQIHTRDSSLRSTLISNELHLIAGVLGNDFDMNIHVMNFEVIPYQDYDKTEYILRLTVKINEEVDTVSI